MPGCCGVVSRVDPLLLVRSRAVVGRQSARPRSKCPDPKTELSAVNDSVGASSTMPSSRSHRPWIVSATNGRECAPRRRRRHRPDRSMVHPPDPPVHPSTLPTPTLPPPLHLHRCRRRRSPPPHCCRNRTRAAHARRARSHHDIKCPGADLPDRDAARFVSRGTSQAARAYNDVRSQRARARRPRSAWRRSRRTPISRGRRGACPSSRRGVRRAGAAASAGDRRGRRTAPSCKTRCRLRSRPCGSCDGGGERRSFPFIEDRRAVARQRVGLETVHAGAEQQPVGLQPEEEAGAVPPLRSPVQNQRSR